MAESARGREPSRARPATGTLPGGTTSPGRAPVSAPVVITKVRIPTAPSMPVERIDSLLDVVWRHRLALVVAPAGSGKTTLLNTVAGLLRPASGTIHLDGRSIAGAEPATLVRRGLALVPERRRIFKDLTVEENLKLAGITSSAAERSERLARMADLFADLAMMRSAVESGLEALDGGYGVPRAACVAKAEANRALHTMSREGIQLHGGIGMTDEYDVGFYLKRARVLEASWGSSTYLKDRFAKLAGY